MKRLLSLCLVLSLIVCLSGCISQQEADVLSNQIAELEKDLSEAKQQISGLKEDVSDANSVINTLKTEKNTLTEEKTNLISELKEVNEALENAQTTIETLQTEVDELKNGPERSLAAIRNAYDAKKWNEVISLAKALHAKYPGMDHDIQAQALATDAQRIIDEEKAQAEAEAAKTLQDKVRGLIRITKLSCSKPNSAGGVGINLHFVNMHPQKTIKYLYVSVYPYNAVGDMMDCDIRDYSRYTCEATGPYAPGAGINASTGWWWPNAWYNWNISYIELSSVRIVYTDGTSVSLSSKELPYAIW